MYTDNVVVSVYPRFNNSPRGFCIGVLWYRSYMFGTIRNFSRLWRYSSHFKRNSKLRTLKSLDSLERLDRFDRPESLGRFVKLGGLRYFEFLLDLSLTTGDTRQTFIAVDSHRKENEIRDRITKQFKCQHIDIITQTYKHGIINTAVLYFYF